MTKKVDLIILAGGRGSRISKHLKNIPKPLFKFNNIRFLQFLINHYSKFPFDNAYILAGYRGNQIHKLYNNKDFNFLKFRCVIEKNELGTGGCLSQLKNIVKNDFMVANGDSILLENLNFLFEKKNTNNLIFLTQNNKYKQNLKLSKLDTDQNGYVEEKLNGQYMNAGIYFFKNSIIRKIESKKQSLEEELLPKLISKKKIRGVRSKAFFTDIGTDNNLKYAKKNLPIVLKKKAVFLDRDGVINFDHGYVHKFSDFKLRPGVVKGLKLLIKKNFNIFIITNQAGIAKKKFTLNDFIKLHKKIKNFFSGKNINFDDVQFSPFHRNGKIKKYKRNSQFRKPGNLMIKKVFLNFIIDKKNSFSIGDKETDKIAFTKSNLKFEYAKDNFFHQIKQLINDD